MPNNRQWRVVHYETANGARPVEEFLDGLTRRERAKALAVIDLLEEEGPDLRRPYADTLKDGIHELRIRVSRVRLRVFYFFCEGQDIVLTHGFKKKVSRVPESQIRRACRCRDDWVRRGHEDAQRVSG
jgi:phage-related protein